jgi:hypothetical protein
VPGWLAENNMVRAHNEAGDRKIRPCAYGIGSDLAYRALNAKGMKNNVPDVLLRSPTGSAIIRMCILRASHGKDKAKQFLQNPSLFVTFRAQTH